MASKLRATTLVCTLNPSPKESSSEQLAGEVLKELQSHGLEGTPYRVVDHNVRFGVETDMGDDDE